MVRYLPERVLRQFGYIQTVFIHPCESAPPYETLCDITLHFQCALDFALTPWQLGDRAVYGVEATEGYIQWFYAVSHPHMILPNLKILVSRPPERETIDEIVVQEDRELGFLDLSGRFGRIRDYVYDVMYNGVVPQGYEEWQHLEEVLRYVHGGKVYHCRQHVEDVRGGGKGGGGGVVIRVDCNFNNIMLCLNILDDF